MWYPYASKLIYPLTTFNKFLLISTIFWSTAVLVVFQTPLTTSLIAYSGMRMVNDSIRKVHFHESIIIIAERENNTNELINCEIHDVGNERDKFLGDIDDDFGEPEESPFNDIIDLMTQCDGCGELPLTVDEIAFNIARKLEVSPRVEDAMGGIVPGTFWCGKGSLAMNYFDLGAERDLDKCCRRHDVCPVRLLSKEEKYGLTNDSDYTKSHCVCDDQFSVCLKRLGGKWADIVGTMYFNLARMECVAEDHNGKRLQESIRF